MSKVKTYDKVSWHFPGGKNCPSLEVAKIHFRVIMKWLNDHQLLTATGIELTKSGIDSDFALTSDLVTMLGNRVLEDCYSTWVQSLTYGKQPATTVLDQSLKKLGGVRPSQEHRSTSILNRW